MRKVVLAITAFLMTTFAFGQDEAAKADSTWTYVANVGINLSQTSFSNWALGGEGSVGGVAILNLGANYKKGKHTWDNSFVGQYGLQKIDNEDTKKSIDQFELNSKYGYKIAPKWALSGLVGVKSQFSKGYEYDGANKMEISNFFAPGYVTTAVGLDYKPNDWFSLFLSPVTGKHTFVLDDALSDIGAYGVDPGKKYLGELGAMAKADLQKEIMKNVNLVSSLTLFSAYNNNFGNVDVTWDMALAMKVNKYISATITTSLVYDDDISSEIQFKEVIGVGFAYNFMEK